MKFAIIETGGKQYKVEPGKALKIEKLGGGHAAGDTVVFDKVLLWDDGTETKIGTPYVEGAKVEAEFVEEGRGKKVTVVRFRAKVRYHKKRGHRQPYAKIKVK
ncbi:MAG: 50S ribosomal protein L21 [Parcubacteria group bacterium]|nr:50S ribosomal protein L21 [Parcubacteria group bacterium]